MTSKTERAARLGALAMLGVLAVAGLFQAEQAAAETMAMAQIASGDLIKSDSSAAVYYMGADGFRYVFPNEKTYFTWYTNFDGVKMISTADMASIQLGGNATYKPNSRLVKTQTDAKVYAVMGGGVLHWMSTEASVVNFYGTDWNTKVDDIPEGFFNDYTIGSPVLSEDDYMVFSNINDIFNINQNFDLMAPAEVSVTDAGFMPYEVNIEAGQGIRFTNTGTTAHAAL